MKNIIYILTIIGGSFTCFSSQVGINTNVPLTTLEVKTKDINNPLKSDGVIIPRVTTLNMVDSKEHGLMVFLDYENPATEEIERGFYWWNDNTKKWIPFFSMNKMKKDKTITYVSCKNSFEEGNLTSSSTNFRTLGFDSSTLIANDTANFEVNTAGELVVKKAGIYYVQAVISLNSSSVSGAGARDSYEAKIFVNGLEPSPSIRTAYGFPNGGTSFNSNSAMSGYVTLQANDKLIFSINRYYRDETYTDPSIITPNSVLSNLTLRYIGL